MAISAIGGSSAFNGSSFNSLAGLTGDSSALSGTNATGNLVSLLGGIDQAMQSGALQDLAPSAKVAISDAAQSLLAGEDNANQGVFGELAQALILALMLKLLET
jgi:hypothetical protein